MQLRFIASHRQETGQQFGETRQRAGNVIWKVQLVSWSESLACCYTIHGQPLTCSRAWRVVVGERSMVVVVRMQECRDARRSLVWTELGSQHRKKLIGLSSTLSPSWP